MGEEVGAVEALSETMLRHTRDEHGLQLAALGALANIARHHEFADKQSSPSLFWSGALDAAAMTMDNYPSDTSIQTRGCAFLWQLSMQMPKALAKSHGLKGKVEVAAEAGVHEARWLLDCVPWQSVSASQRTTGL